MRRACLTLLLACLVALGVGAAPAAAQGGGESLAKMVQQLRDKGRIDACSFSTEELKRAQRDIPPDIEQYAPDLETAIDAAVQARARGACREGGGGGNDGGGASGGAAAGGSTPAAPGAVTPAPAQTQPQATTPAVPGQGSTPQPTPDPQPAPAAADSAIPQAVDAAPASSTSASDAPAALILLIVLGLLLLAAAMVAAAVRWLAWEPAWLVRSRHATAEAGWRTSAAWSEFTDWVRLGR